MTGSNDKKVSKPINSDTSEYQRTHYNVLCILELNELYSERGMSPLKVNNKKVVEMLNENFRSGSWARVKNKERLENIKIVLNKHRDFLDRYGFDPKFYKTV